MTELLDDLGLEQQDLRGGPLEFRSITEFGVDYPKRTIELIVMPYEQATMIHEPGRSYEEIVSRGAWGNIQARARRVKVNRDHDVTRTCGHAVTLHPSRDEGLVAELKMSKIGLGQETLILADEGNLAASAGFALLRGKRDAEIWETRNRRRLNHLWLGHIALVPDPAYEGAEVLAVRHDTPPGPAVMRNLEKLELEHWQQVYADINARYA